jgi:hypothetical protein
MREFETQAAVVKAEDLIAVGNFEGAAGIYQQSASGLKNSVKDLPAYGEQPSQNDGVLTRAYDCAQQQVNRAGKLLEAMQGGDPVVALNLDGC